MASDLFLLESLWPQAITIPRIVYLLADSPPLSFSSPSLPRTRSFPAYLQFSAAARYMHASFQLASLYGVHKPAALISTASSVQVCEHHVGLSGHRQARSSLLHSAEFINHLYRIDLALGLQYPNPDDRNSRDTGPCYSNGSNSIVASAEEPAATASKQPKAKRFAAASYQLSVVVSMPEIFWFRQIDVFIIHSRSLRPKGLRNTNGDP